MNENLLQFIWQRLAIIPSQHIFNTDGDELIILYPGTLNQDAGPDFLEAKIKVGSTTWIGNIEIHIKTSDWVKHQHHQNEQYQNIILHVVYENDIELKSINPSEFMTLELKNLIDQNILNRYDFLMQQKKFIPCEKSIQKVPEIIISQQLNRCLAERLESKSQQIGTLLSIKNNNWQEVFYVQLARGFGIRINQEPFEQMALQTPMSLIAKYKNNPLQIEALLFGQAGFLNDYFDDPYPILLQQEYEYLKKVYHLQAVNTILWKFLRLRPANFPTIRIAQFAQLVIQSTHLFSKIIQANTVQEIIALFDLTLPEFWETHYTFAQSSTKRKKHLGIHFIHTIIINSIVPTLFIYGKLQGGQAYCDKAIRFLNDLPFEKNQIVNSWKELPIEITNAAESQGVLELYHQYCTQKNCLSCSIGYHILKKAE